ncbi:MAG: hypothetical protein SV201_07075 [Pseudomonadota bacterium]|nr:hypothetical protein [Pseudomonadota bacterium]
MEIAKFNKLVNLLLIYMVGVILVIGLFGSDIVADMANFVFIYGIPLIIFLIIYFVTVAAMAHDFIKRKHIDITKFILSSLKIFVAITPMFYLNNTGAMILSFLRLT